MYLILVMAWGLKISSPKLMPNDTGAEVVNRWSDVVTNAALGPVAGWIVLASVLILYGFVLVASLFPETDDGGLRLAMRMYDSATCNAGPT